MRWPGWPVGDAGIAWALGALVSRLVIGAGAWGCLMGGMVMAGTWLAVIKRWAVSSPNPIRVHNFMSSIRVGAHRGAALDSPENTLYAFAQAKANGADFVELDLSFSRDGVPIVFHDATLERTTNGVGLVRKTSFNDIANLECRQGVDSPSRAPAVTVPTLREAISAIMDLGISVVIDIKEPHPNLVPTLLSLYREFPALYCFGLVSSYYWGEIMKVRRADRRILTAHTWCWDLHRDVYWQGGECVSCARKHHWFWEAALLDVMEFVLLHSGILHRFSGSPILLVDHSAISPAYEKAVAATGLYLIAYTVNDYHERLFLLRSLRVPFITDAVADLAPILTAQEENRDRAPFVNHRVCMLEQ